MSACEGVCIVTGANAGIGASASCLYLISSMSHFNAISVCTSCRVHIVQYVAGKEVTAGLMQEGHHVIMACRNMQRCRCSAICNNLTICLTVRTDQLSKTLDSACHAACFCEKSICCRCEEARTELQQQPLPGSCECLKMDLGDFASVRTFAHGALQQLQAQHKKIQILVNNAG